MRAKGITYDTGFVPTGLSGPSTYDGFDEATTRRDMLVIRDQLHCDAVRVTGSIWRRRWSAR